MFEYLIAREKEEMLRVSSRALSFPDGQCRKIEAFRLVWTWFDRVVACSWAPDEDELLEMTLNWADEKSVPVEEALGHLLDYFVRTSEEMGMDITDDTLKLSVARQQMERFHERKQKR